MTLPYPTHIVLPCPRHEDNTMVHANGPPVPISRHLASRFSSISPSQDIQAFKYALGTLEYRKQRNRKRTETGEFVWSDEADLVFALALISWTTNRSNRVGARRAIFLQQFLARNGFTKTRKQIASRLQVLKGEWRATSYATLLEDPDRREMSKRRHLWSPPSPVCRERSLSIRPCHSSLSTPSPTSSAPSPASSGSFPLGDELNQSINHSTFDVCANEPFCPPVAVQNNKHPSKLIDDNVSGIPHDQRRLVPSQFAPPGDSYTAVDHRPQTHNPAPLVQWTLPPPSSLYPLTFPYNPPPTQTVYANSRTSYVQYGSRALDRAVADPFQTHLFTH